MPFSHTDHDAPTRDLMNAALNTAWTVLCVGLAPTEADRAAMVTAITNTVAGGERDFMRLQQKALDALGVRPLVKAVDRRKQIRLVHSSDEPLLL